MSKIDEYRRSLRALPPEEWEAYLLSHSGLPGARANLELAQAAAEEGSPGQFRAWLGQYDAPHAPGNTQAEILAVCGTLGLGRMLAGGDRSVLDEIRASANDPRWRAREAAAMALQRLGAVDMPPLLEEMEHWAGGTFLEQRAAAAALCEPALLGDPAHARRTLAILDGITARLAGQSERRSEAFAALRKGLGYCWSVAVVALPQEGKPLVEKWLDSPDPDVRWIMRQNLSKKRLERLDPAWVHACRARLGAG